MSWHGLTPLLRCIGCVLSYGRRSRALRLDEPFVSGFRGEVCDTLLSCLRTGVVSNISQCQITRICAIARARSRKVSCTGVYLARSANLPEGLYILPSVISFTAAPSGLLARLCHAFLVYFRFRFNNSHDHDSITQTQGHCRIIIGSHIRRSDATIGVSFTARTATETRRQTDRQTHSDTHTYTHQITDVYQYADYPPHSPATASIDI